MFHHVMIIVGLKNTFKKAIQLYRCEGLVGIRRGIRIIAGLGEK